MKAVWNGTVAAESTDTVVIENNHYFPLASVRRELLEPSDTATDCSWKGTANYYTLNFGGESNRDAVWYFAAPKEAAKQIRGRVAFWKGVEVMS